VTGWWIGVAAVFAYLLLEKKFGKSINMDSGSSGIFSIQTSAFSIPILALGNGWLVADKPCELSVHKYPGHDLCTILF